CRSVASWFVLVKGEGLRDALVSQRHRARLNIGQGPAVDGLALASHDVADLGGGSLGASGPQDAVQLEAGPARKERPARARGRVRGGLARSPRVRLEEWVFAPRRHAKRGQAR